MKICLIALAAFCFCALGACSQSKGDPEPENKSAQSQGTPKSGEGVVVISRTSQEKGGIVTAPVGTALHRGEIKAYGMVIDLRDFFAMRNKFAEARALVQKTGADLDASRKAYERMKTLYQHAQDVSAKALQEAEAAWRSDEADARAARSSLESAKVQAQQQWGDRLAEWLMKDSPEFERLRQRQDILVQVTIPPDVAVASGDDTAVVRTAEGKSVPAQLVSSSPRTDTRIQGMSFFYRAPALPELISGMNVEAYMPAGPRLKGFVIPASAVVWRRGRASVYVQEGAERFVRREIPTGNPVQDGYFSVSGFTAGERVVVKGAQALLSAEFLPARHEEED